MKRTVRTVSIGKAESRRCIARARSRCAPFGATNLQCLRASRAPRALSRVFSAAWMQRSNALDDNDFAWLWKEVVQPRDRTHAHVHLAMYVYGRHESAVSGASIVSQWRACGRLGA